MIEPCEALNSNKKCNGVFDASAPYYYRTIIPFGAFLLLDMQTPSTGNFGNIVLEPTMVILGEALYDMVMILAQRTEHPIFFLYQTCILSIYKLAYSIYKILSET